MQTPIRPLFSLVFLALIVAPAAGDEVAFYQTAASPWAGLYVGASGGLAIAGESDWTVEANGAVVSPGFDNGGIFGAQAGYLFQWGSLVAGAEVSYSATSNLEGSTSCPSAVFTCSNEMDNLFLINGRLGYAFGNSLLYGTGGFARADLGFDAARPGNHPNNTYGSTTANGWNIGAGFEYILSDAIILGVEYVHADLSDGSVRLIENDGDVDIIDTDSKLDLVRLRLDVSIDGLARGK